MRNIPAMVAILNYGMANLRSVQKAFEHVGHRAAIITTPDEIRSADRLVLPGVGAVADALAHLRDQSLDAAVLDFIRSGKPFLGICLGLQMLFSRCFENGEHAGLGHFAGDCVRFDVDRTMNLKVPHMGWNQVKFRSKSPLFKGLEDGCDVYFVHSYHVVPQEKSIVAGETDYGRDFVSSVWQDNVVATQFHPEKSQAVGLKMLENFATWRP